MNDSVSPADTFSALLNERSIQAQLLRKLWHNRLVLIPNIYINQWESDLVSITPSGYWTEYEIKTTLADYRADFHKAVSRYRTSSATKHDIYSSARPARWGTQPVPIPKHFYFILPVELFLTEHSPDHCGVISYRPVGKYFSFVIQRKAPVLRCHTKITPNELFRLFSKSSLRFGA